MVFDPANVRADILKCAGEAQVRASTELLVNLRQMVNEPAFSDVVFVCKGGNRVHASRMLLAGRSNVFKSMFMNIMVESSLSEIELPEILSPVLLSVVEFLYTGTMLDYHPQSWRMACEVISASRFFLLPDLEMSVHKFMLNQISVAAEDLTMAASLLTEALEYDAMFDKTDAFLRELVTILSSNWSHSSYVRNLSQVAFQYLLVNTKGNYDVHDKISLKEYLRFRQVIRWWVYRSDFGSCATEEFVNFIAPDEKGARSLCTNPDHVEKAESPANLSKEWNFRQLDEESRNSTIGLLSNIDCKWIHPVLLAKVVEPLKIISAEEIQNSFRFHALRRPLILDQLKCDWEHGESYKALEQGNVILKCGPTLASAVMTAAMSPSSGVYQWHFVVEGGPCNFFQLGFIYYSSRVGAEKPKFEGNRLSSLEHARVVGFRAAYAWVLREGPAHSNFWIALGKNFGVNPKACFNYNSWKRTCSLSINDKDLGVVWKDLPEERFYPAVSFAEGRVHIELVSGFEIL